MNLLGNNKKSSLADKTFRVLALISICLLKIGIVTSLRSVSYKPNPGLTREQWWSNRNCPSDIKNLDKFEYHYSANSDRQNKRFTFTAYLVPPTSGSHKVVVRCQQECTLYIELHPAVTAETVYINSYSSLKTEYSKALEMRKGFRYKTTLQLSGYYSQSITMKVGILLSNGSEIATLDQNYLWRSMEFYKISGLLTEQFNSITVPSPVTYDQFLSVNSAKYPSNPSKVFCRSTTYDTYSSYSDNYALRYTGYFKPIQSGSYQFHLKCNYICQLSFKGENNQVVKQSSVYNGAYLNVGALTGGKYYQIEIFMMESTGQDYIRIRWKRSGDWYWKLHATTELSNFLPSETDLIIPKAAVMQSNSTSLLVTINSLPTVPPDDQWTSTQRYDIVYYRSIDASIKNITSLNGPLPISKIITGLNKYTDYTIYLHYYGKMKSTIEHNMISGVTQGKTDEDVPDDYPPSLSALKISSTVIKISWNSMPASSRTNGLIVGYRARYARKDDSPTVWLYQDTTSRNLFVNSLEFYTMYVFSIAAKTSKGTGVYSPLVEERTMEDRPSASPSDIVGTNTSSTSILIKWGDVPINGQNGIITGYYVYIKETSSETWLNPVSASQKSYEQSGLKYWTFYDVKIAAKTSVGEGTESNVTQIRTDEDRPTGAPQNLNTTASSSTSIAFKWEEIAESLRNGEIISYEVRYQRKDATNALQSKVFFSKDVLLTELDKFIEYTMVVAGMTSKGAGLFSPPIIQRTLEDIPTDSPKNVAGGFISSTEINATWNIIPVPFQNGIIRSYNISYKLNASFDDWMFTSVDSQKFKVEIGNLKYYTLYDVKVAGRTSVGLGPYSAPVSIRTDANAPSEPPANFNGTFVNHTSIVIDWSNVPEESRHGIILGYRISFADATSISMKWENRTLPNDPTTGIFKMILAKLKIYTPYIFKILAYTYRGEGPFSNNITVWTDDFKPDDIPRNVSKDNRTSTEITLSWKSMAEINGMGNGKITGYRIRYQVVDCHADRPVGCNESQAFTIVTNDSKPYITIPSLRKYTNYSISIQAINRKGVSNYTAPIYIKTDEDKPDAPPQRMESWPSKTDSISLYWSPMPESLRNGIIIGYRIFYKQLNAPVRNLKRAPRSVDALATLGALPGERVKDVNATTYETNLVGLSKYSWYEIRIGALTSKGLGPTFSINGTCKQEAPVEAPFFDVIDEYSFNEVSLNWRSISSKGARGEVLGYRIHYWPIEQNDVPIFNGETKYISVFEPNRNLTIKELMPYTIYGITVSAFTEGGFGVSSTHKKAETCRCPKILTIAFENIVPLIYMNKTLSGLMPKYVEEAVSTCCGNCSLGQGPSSIDWSHDALNESSMKSNIESLLKAVLSETHIAMPFFKDTVTNVGSSSSPYDYIPFLQSPGMVFFKRRPTRKEVGNKNARNMVDSLLNLYSVLVVVILFIVTAGLIFWVLERGGSNSDFPNSCLFGSGTGTWLAFITMTTAGYGDITARTILGRLFTIVWTFIGLVLTALIVGQITNSLLAKTVPDAAKQVVSSATEKVLASNDTLMIAITKLKKRATVGNTSDPEEVKRLLLAGEVSRVMIEAYRASKMKEDLEHPDISFEKLEKTDASYGFALNGEGRRLKSCMARFVKENSQRILEEVSKYVISFESKDFTTEEVMPIIMSSDADITATSIKYFGWALFTFVTFGAIYDLRRYIRGRSKVQVEVNDIEELFQTTDDTIKGMYERVSKLVSEMDEKHTLERGQLVKMGLKDLKAMMPELLIFHDDLREQIPKDGKSVDIELTEINKRYYDESDSDEETVDMPIDYKVS